MDGMKYQNQITKEEHEFVSKVMSELFGTIPKPYDPSVMDDRVRKPNGTDRFDHFLKQLGWAGNV